MPTTTPTSRVLLRSAPTTVTSPRPRRRRSVVAGAFVALVGILALTFGAGVSVDGMNNIPAYAHDPDAFHGDTVGWPLDGICYDAPTMLPPVKAWTPTDSGNVDVSAGLGGRTPDRLERDLRSSTNYTALEWYGPILSWSTFAWKDLEPYTDCSMSLGPNNVLPNAVMQVNGLFAQVGAWILSAAISTDVVNLIFIENTTMQDVIKTLKNTLFLNYLPIVVLVGAVAMMWSGIVKKSFRTSLQQGIWMLMAAFFAMVFLVNPLWVAKTVNDFTFQTTAFLINSAVGGVSPGREDICSAGPAPGSSASNKASREVRCQLWKVYVYQPWAQGQVGDAYKQGEAGKGVQVSTTATFRNNTSLAMNVLDMTMYNRNDVLYGTYTTGSAALLDKKKEQLEAVHTTVKEHNMSYMWGQFSGMDSGARMSAALLGLVSQAAAFVPLLILSFGMIAQQIVFVFLLVSAPLFLTIGIQPTFGRRIALGWLEMLVGTALKRIIAGAVIGLLLMFISVAASLDAMVGGIVMLLSGFIALKVRGDLVKKAGGSINFGGTPIAAAAGIENKLDGGTRALQGLATKPLDMAKTGAQNVAGGAIAAKREGVSMRDGIAAARTSSKRSRAPLTGVGTRANTAQAHLEKKREEGVTQENTRKAQQTREDTLAAHQARDQRAEVDRLARERAQAAQTQEALQRINQQEGARTAVPGAGGERVTQDVLAGSTGARGAGQQALNLPEGARGPAAAAALASLEASETKLAHAAMQVKTGIDTRTAQILAMGQDQGALRAQMAAHPQGGDDAMRARDAELSSRISTATVERSDLQQRESRLQAELNANRNMSSALTGSAEGYTNATEGRATQEVLSFSSAARASGETALNLPEMERGPAAAAALAEVKESEVRLVQAAGQVRSALEERTSQMATLAQEQQVLASQMASRPDGGDAQIHAQATQLSARIEDVTRQQGALQDRGASIQLELNNARAMSSNLGRVAADAPVGGE
jgi:hypothetical protein